MPASEIRKSAREALSGRWGKAIGIFLAYALITFAFGFIQGLFKSSSAIYSLIDIAILVITIPLGFGVTICFMKFKREEEVSAFDFFSEGFSRFGKSWGIWFRTLLKLLIPLLCLIAIIVLMTILVFFTNAKLLVASGTISSPSMAILSLISVVIYILGIVYIMARSLLYSLAYYIGYDNPNLSSKECVNQSEKFMKGNRGNLFLLYLSFIGWFLLSCLTFGIGFIWLIPYIQVSTICFYDRIVNKEENI